jgi:hypothetical protein
MVNTSSGVFVFNFHCGFLMWRQRRDWHVAQAGGQSHSPIIMKGIIVKVTPEFVAAKPQSNQSDISKGVSKAVGNTPPEVPAGPISSASLIAGFNLDAIRLPQQFDETINATRVITSVPVRKSQKYSFFRVNPDASWRLQVMVLELKDEGEMYVLTPELYGVIPGLTKRVTLHTAVDRLGNVFLIPVPLPDEEGRRNPWHQSLQNAVTVAETTWVRAEANKRISGYNLTLAHGSVPDPDWPTTNFKTLVEIAFRDRIISSVDHPLVKNLLGAWQ